MNYRSLDRPILLRDHIQCGHCQEWFISYFPAPKTNKWPRWEEQRTRDCAHLFWTYIILFWPVIGLKVFFHPKGWQQFDPEIPQCIEIKRNKFNYDFATWKLLLNSHDWFCFTQIKNPTTISCNTWENRPCTSSGQNNRTNPVSRGVGESAPSLWAWVSCPHFSSVTWWHGQSWDAHPCHPYQQPRQVEEQALRS